MPWAVFPCLMSAQHCTGGAVDAATCFARFDTSIRVSLTTDVGQPRRMTRLSRQPVDRASSSRFACMPRDCMREIANSAGAASPAHTPAHWQVQLPVFCPFSLPHPLPHRWEGASRRSTRVALNNLEICAVFSPVSLQTALQHSRQASTKSSLFFPLALTECTYKHLVCVQSVRATSLLCFVLLEQLPSLHPTCLNALNGSPHTDTIDFRFFN